MRGIIKSEILIFLFTTLLFADVTINLNGLVTVDGNKELSTSSFLKSGYSITKDSIEEGEGEYVLNSNNYLLTLWLGGKRIIKCQVGDGKIYTIEILDKICFDKPINFCAINNSVDEIIKFLGKDIYFTNDDEESYVIILSKKYKNISFITDYMCDTCSTKNNAMLNNNDFMKAKCASIILTGNSDKPFK